MKTLYLFYGFGCEYVLHDLFQAMENDYECLEIDVLTIPNSKKIINQLIGKSVVFVTSAHFLLDQSNFFNYYPNYYPNKNTFYGPLEIIALLKPIKSVYIPHDLTQPFIQYEDKFLNQFDLFLSPCEPYTSAYSLICPTAEVGWVKYHQLATTIKPRNKVIWFLSDFTLHVKMGKEKSYEINAPLLTQGVSLKFPVWNSADEFTQYYRMQGVDVYDPRVISYNLIKAHDIIITNGLSSIVAESYLIGKTTVNIMENSHYGADGLQILQTNYPELQIYTTIQDVKINNILPTNQPCVLHPFDLPLTIKLITAK